MLRLGCSSVAVDFFCFFCFFADVFAGRLIFGVTAGCLAGSLVPDVSVAESSDNDVLGRKSVIFVD